MSRPRAATSRHISTAIATSRHISTAIATVSPVKFDRIVQQLGMRHEIHYDGSVSVDGGSAAAGD